MKIERAVPGLGHVCLHVNEPGCTIDLTLDGYQSRCVRTWLEARWSSPALTGCTIDFHEGSLRLSKRLQSAGAPDELLSVWIASVLKDLNINSGVPDSSKSSPKS